MTRHSSKLFIVGGAGMVGATIAYAIALREIVHEIILIDVAKEMALGQAEDISHATAFVDGVRVRTGDYNEIEDDDIIVVTCGAAQKPGQTRLELLDVNVKIIKDVVNKIMLNGKQVFIIMVTNPVDVLTYVALKVSGLPRERVFGTGTTLDSARLRVGLANRLNVSQKQVQAYILGEHGDSSFAALSSATVGGVPLTNLPGYDDDLVNNIEDDIRSAAYRIIESKKSTYYGIGSVVANIVDGLVHSRRNIYPVCSLLSGEYGLDDVVLGVPSYLSSNGVKIIDNMPLSDEEKKNLRRSAAIIEEATSRVSE